jgi:hypothetical protein
MLCGLCSQPNLEIFVLLFVSNQHDNDTSDKLFGGINDTADKFIDPAEQLSPVSTTQVNNDRR